MKGKVVSILCVVTMAALCLSPCLCAENVHASEPVTRTINGFDLPTLNDWSHDGWAIAATFVSPIFLVGYLYGHNPSESGGGAVPTPIQPTDPEDVLSDYYRMEAEKTQLVLSRSASDFSVSMSLDSTTWHFTNAYWQRSVEVVAASEWDAMKDYEPNANLRKAEVFTNMSGLYYSWQAVADASFFTEKNNRAIWSDKGYDVNMGWNGSCNSSGLIYPDFCSYCVPTSDANLVFIDNDLPEDAHDEYTSTIYVIGSGGSLTAEDGTKYTLYPGRSSIKSIPSGIYALEEGSLYAGSMVPVAGGADLKGAAVLVDDRDFTVAVPDDSGYSLIFSDGTSIAADSVYYSIIYDNGKVMEAEISGVISSWDDMIAEFENTVSRCVLAGSNAWKLYDAVGEASQVVSLSALLPDIENTTLSGEQAYALSILAMIEMSEYLDTHESDLTAEDLKASAESLDMVCHGRITDPNGNVIIENAIFTPFNYVRDQKLSVHSPVSWDQPGYALVWAKGDYDSWDGKASPSDMKLITLTEGFEMSIDTIVLHNTPVDACVLEIKQIEKILTDLYKPHSSPSDLPEFADWSVYAKLLFVLLGAIVIILGIRHGNIWAIILGAAMAALGWIFGGNIMTLLYEWFGIGRIK